MSLEQLKWSGATEGRGDGEGAGRERREGEGEGEGEEGASPSTVKGNQVEPVHR